MPQRLPSVWDDVDRALAAPPAAPVGPLARAPVKTPSVWDEVDSVLNAPVPPRSQRIGPSPKKGPLGLADFMKGLVTSEAGPPRLSKKGEALIPFVGAITQAVDAYDVVRAARRIRDDEGTASDERLLEEFQARDVEAQQRGTSMLYDIANVIAQLPGFAVEFAATGGAFTGAKTVVGNALAKIATTRAGNIAAKAASYVAGSAAQTAAMPQRVAAEALRRQVPKPQEIEKELTDWDDDFVPALARAVPDQFIEVFSERTGGVLEGPLAALVKLPLAKRVAALKSAVAARWIKSHPDQTMTDLLAKVRSATAWNGVIGEIFEERVGEALRATQPYLHEPGTDQPPMIRVLTGAPTGQRQEGQSARLQAVKDLGRQLAIEASAFAIPGAAGAVLTRLPASRRQPAPGGPRQPPRATPGDVWQQVDAALAPAVVPPPAPVAVPVTSTGPAISGSATEGSRPVVPPTSVPPNTHIVASAEEYRDLVGRYGPPNAIDVGAGVFDSARTGALFIDDETGQSVAFAWPESKLGVPAAAPRVTLPPIEEVRLGALPADQAARNALMRSGQEAEALAQPLATDLSAIEAGRAMERRVRAGIPPAGLAERRAEQPLKTTPRAEGPHEFASTQVNLPVETATKVKALALAIPDADLAEDGREDQPHITVKYGLHADNAEAVRTLLANEPPITVTLGKTSFFPNGESDSGDVLKIDATSSDLTRLNKQIADALETTDTHPDYQPHATIAYLKPGKGQQYAGNTALEGQTITLDQIVFAAKDGTQTAIPLTGVPHAIQERGTDITDQAVRRFQWMRNKEGGQAFGNQEVVVPLTPAVFAEYLSPFLRAGPVDTLEAYQDKYPEDTHIRLRKVGDKPWILSAGPPDNTGSIEEVSRDTENSKRWRVAVPSFESPEAQVRGTRADSETSSPSEEGAVAPFQIGDTVEWRTGAGRPQRGTVRDLHPDGSLEVQTNLKTTPIRHVLLSARPRVILPNQPKGREVDDTTSALPQGYQELPRPPRRPQRPSATMRPSAIITELQEALGDLPINVGRFRGGARAIHKGDVRAIRLKTAGDLRAVFHEGGHEFDINILKLNRSDPRWAAELLALGQATSRPSYTKSRQRKEGAAEFFVLYLTEPAAAEAAAPAYFAEFERRLAEKPALQRDLLKTRQNIEGYLGLSYADRGRLRIDRGTTPGALATARQDPRAALRTLATKTIDRLLPLKVAVEQMRDGRPLDYQANAYVLARIASGATAKAEEFIETGVRGAAGKFIGPSLADAITPARAHLDAFGDYLVALRAKELITDRGMKAGMSIEEADAIIAETEKRADIAAFKQARDAVYAYQDAMLVYAKTYGAFSGQQLDQIRALNQAYVPMQRVMEDTAARVAGVAQRIANRASPVKRIHGSGRDIVDPFESMVQNTFVMVDMVEKNLAMQALVMQAEQAAGSARWLERIPAPKVATRFHLSDLSREIGQALDQAGIELPDNFDDALDALVTVFTPAVFAKGQDQIVTVIRNGERQFWQVNDTALYEAITVMGPRETGSLMHLLESPTRLLRAGATLTPGFIIRNPGRDTVIGYVQSRYGFLPFYDTLRGLIGQVRGDADAKLFFTSGIAQATLAAQDRRSRQEMVRKIQAGGGLKNVVFHPIDLLRAISSQLEVATRLGEFKLALDAGGVEQGIMTRLLKSGQARPALTEETLTRGTLAARDVTTDFSRAGTWTREVNRFYAFFNARVQGYARMAETVQRDPIGAGLKLATVAAFSAALWAFNDDDDEYAELPEWEKHTYWHVKLWGARTWFRIPKPFEWGYVADLTEAAMSYAKQGDSTRFKEMKDYVFGTKPAQMVFSLLPTGLLPLVEAGANYSSFRDTNIVRPWDLDLPTDLQYNDFTSETAKQLGKVIPVAPSMLDHLIFGYTAGFGRGVVSGIDVGLTTTGAASDKNMPARPWQQQPVVGNFLRDVSFGPSAQSIQDLYDVSELIATVEAGIKTDRRRGRPASGLARIDAAKQDLPWDRRRAIHRARQSLQELSPTIKAIYAAPPAAMSPAQKRERLDRLYERMAAIARHALGRSPLRTSQPPIAAPGR